MYGAKPCRSPQGPEHEEQGEHRARVMEDFALSRDTARRQAEHDVAEAGGDADDTGVVFEQKGSDAAEKIGGQPHHETCGRSRCDDPVEGQ